MYHKIITGISPMRWNWRAISHPGTRGSSPCHQASPPLPLGVIDMYKASFV